MAISNSKLYDAEALPACEPHRGEQSLARPGTLARLLRPLTVFARSVVLTFAMVVDAISGRFDP
jgi:hypothetical protein